ncbi:MAG: hypothetical protein KGJ23_02855 [Euryarchaeota archaeon]|nr:hypothetical protein [Euryarchaeota archaeon]MDE1835538.1 hypothetical protein [Euryarchaeota archaeon]MDE1879629.1 hypothetical protein [Euryarchaeota archaeon]MDE2043840.1 hypothetical protein [Thermoplasmata archaeon]
MKSWRGADLDPELIESCRAYAQGISLGTEHEEVLPGNKGVVRRIRVSHGEQSVIRTEVRSMLTERIFVDATPLGAVLLLLEIARRRDAPKLLVVRSGETAGEYAQGAIEIAWGAVMLEGSGVSLWGGGLPGDPRRLDMTELISLAETVL